MSNRQRFIDDWRRLVARFAGTWMPLVLLALFSLALGDAHFDELTWERLVVYLLGALSLPFGIYRLVHMARMPTGEHPTFLILGFIYESVCFFFIYTTISLLVIQDLAHFQWHVPDSLLFAILVSAVASTAMLNVVVLFLGGRWGVLQEPSDPMPFRALLRWWRRH
jgi:hypothetical protein